MSHKRMIECDGGCGAKLIWGRVPVLRGKTTVLKWPTTAASEKAARDMGWAAPTVQGQHLCPGCRKDKGARR
jgi:hypothetical protein